MRTVAGDAIPIIEMIRAGNTIWRRGCHPTYPRYPSALPLTERDLPRRLQRLEEFIWLKEGPHRECIQQAKPDEEEKKIGGGRRGLRCDATRRSRGRLGG